MGQQEVPFLAFVNDDVAEGAMTFWEKGLPDPNSVSDCPCSLMLNSTEHNFS